MSTRYEIRIELALLMSVLLHVTAGVAWQARHDLLQSPWLRPLQSVWSLYERPLTNPAAPDMTLTFVDVIEEQPEPVPQPEKPKPRTFVETDNAQVTGAKPKEADFYSDRDTVAANTENPMQAETDQPYIAGTDDRIFSTVEVVEPSPARVVEPPVMPPPTPPESKPVEVMPDSVPMVEAPPVLAETVHRLVEETGEQPSVQPVMPEPPPAAVPPNPTATSVTPVAPVSPASGADTGREIVTPRSKITTAGVTRAGVTAFNVAASPFGEYDKKIVRAVQSRWYALINRYGIYERVGTVTIHFKLHDDGTVHGIAVRENTAGEILALYCQKAILDSSPFDPFPDHLRVLIGSEPREVDFTFYY